MSTATAIDWVTANQRYLNAALDVTKQRLVGKGNEARLRAAEQALAAARVAMPALPALERLRIIFGLTEFETELLLFCAAVELDSSVAALCTAAQGDPQRYRPTIGLALAVLPAAHWSAVTPTAPLRHWRLIEVAEGEPLATAPLRIDERVLHYLLGVATLDRRLQPLVRLLEPAAALPASHRQLVERIATLWEEQPAPPPVQICGSDSFSRQAIAAATGERLGRVVYLLRAEDVPAGPAEQELLARLWEREAALSGALALIAVDDGETSRAWLGWLERVQGMVLLASADPLPSGDRLIVRFDVPQPDRTEQRSLWQQILGERGLALNGQLEPLLEQFTLNANAIRAAGLAVSTDQAADWWGACRAQARLRLDGLAQRIETVVSWDDLVLPDEHIATLRQMVAHVRQRDRVYEQWGFGLRGERGLGISALFAGPSGTGKTLAAEVLANELRLDLYRIDLSAVVSKYIGETEKNLRRIFDAAEGGGAILLFDEADALFGRRSEVRDSHDRYANLEVSYLLQRMEAYRGLAILTTNMKQAIDTAFLRRIRFIVNFPFPDAAQRRRIWQRVFPPATPLAELDWARLAQLNLAGGNIRGIALNAAFLAADAGESVTMRHLLSAAHSEYAKLDKPLTETELRGWGGLTHG
ncbi:ATP-binding protein [uncultured Chloroflexus sp.]|uniref:ATP-binding protein n=1 Tax=uncultured Chloroflexus sp. TaxID=214040 RepID=UPI00261D3117|nr:ATP-binding protein [uncultured Chloroflexus sp.]